MFSLPYEIGDGKFILILILQKENHDKMQLNQPIEMELAYLREDWNIMMMHSIIITYPPQHTMNQIVELMKLGDAEGVVKLLISGVAEKDVSGSTAQLLALSKRQLNLKED